MNSVTNAIECLQEKESLLSRFNFFFFLKKEQVPLCKRWVSVNLVETEMQYLFLFFF